MKNTRIVVAFLFLAALHGVGSAAQPPQAEPALSLSTDHSTIVSGSCLQIKVTLRNTTSGTIIFAAPPGISGWPAEEVFEIHVMDAKRIPAPRTAYATAVSQGSISTHTLSPGGVFTSETLLGRIFDLTMPGKYSVWVTLQTGHRRVISSNLVTVTVTAPQVRSSSQNQA